MKKSAPIKQAAAIPFRRNGDDLEFCLITASGSQKWTIPKGIIDPGETPDETAEKETLEEAGLRGRTKGKPIGEYTYRKWGAKLRVTVYLLEVKAQDKKWEEMKIRTRKWCSPSKARKLLAGHPGRTLVKRAAKRLEKKKA
ncbi:MAG: NUDIX hydrolase [Rhodothermia bacterium]|nr:NUDIX hydrolase [Rhodothermia bacterium]